MNIKTVTVIGSGTMGANSAAVFAGSGAKVYLAGRNPDRVISAVKRALDLCEDKDRAVIIPKILSASENFIPNSDLVFESVAESLEAKLEAAGLASPLLGENAFYCSGTSGISITKLSESFPKEKRGMVFGAHLFNPPHRVFLCELTPTRYSDPAKLDALRCYFGQTLRRKVVQVKDSPAFLANRIGFHFINRSAQLAERCKSEGGIDYIDAILGTYTGRSMAPLVTANFVGLDVHHAIVENIYGNTADYAHESFAFPHYARTLVSNGLLGKKTGSGFYRQTKSDRGTEAREVYDVESGEYRQERDYLFPYAENMKRALREKDFSGAFRVLLSDGSREAGLCLDALVDYIVYSVCASEEAGYDPHSADDVMAWGFKWCPPLALIDAFSEVTDFKKLVFAHTDVPSAEKSGIVRFLDSPEKSRYDYRSFFRVKD